MSSAVWACIVYGAVVVAISEALAWYLVYGNAQYQRTAEQLEKQSQQCTNVHGSYFYLKHKLHNNHSGTVAQGTVVQETRQKVENGTRSSSTSHPTNHAMYEGSRTARHPCLLSSVLGNLRVSMVGLVVVLAAYQILTAAYDGVVVAKVFLSYILSISRTTHEYPIHGQLPFEPFSMMRGMTHRGLPGEDYREASSHLLFALSMVVFRACGQKYMELRGWKPKPVPTPSLWEIAEREASKMSHQE